MQPSTRRWLGRALGLLALAGSAACSDSTGGDDDGGLSVPVITSVTPASAEIGSPTMTITLNGNRFRALDVVLLDGQSLPTFIVNAKQITAQLPAGILVNAHVGQLTVV